MPTTESPTAQSAALRRARLGDGKSPFGINRAARRHADEHTRDGSRVSKHYRVDSLTMIGGHTTKPLHPKLRARLIAAHAKRVAR